MNSVTFLYDNTLCHSVLLQSYQGGLHHNNSCVSVHLYLRVVDDMEFLSFLKSKVIFGASVIVIQSYKESDSTTCIHVHNQRQRSYQL